MTIRTKKTLHLTKNGAFNVEKLLKFSVFVIIFLVTALVNIPRQLCLEWDLMYKILEWDLYHICCDKLKGKSLNFFVLSRLNILFR